MPSNRISSRVRRGGALLSLAFAAGAALVTVPAQGQSASEWLTSSGDAARDGWQRVESKITPRNAGKMELLWKTKLAAKPMGMLSFREPLVVTGVKTPDGTHTLAIFAAAANQVFALDAETGKVVWQSNLKWESEKPQEPGEGGGFICTNALSATPVVSPIDAPVRRLYVLASDGYLHTIDLTTGEDAEAALEMLPLPYGKPYGLNLVNNVIYTVTGQGCGGVPNALYAMNLTDKKLTVSSPPQAGLWGTAGPSVGDLLRVRRRGVQRGRGQAVDQRGGLHVLERHAHAERLLLALEPRVADTARPGHERHAGGVSLEGAGRSGGIGQRGPLLCDGLEIDGRRGP